MHESTNPCELEEGSVIGLKSKEYLYKLLVKITKNVLNYLSASGRRDVESLATLNHDHIEPHRVERSVPVYGIVRLIQIGS